MGVNEDRPTASELLIEPADEHVVLTLNRPERRNALSVALRDAISEIGRAHV
jgi:enoyl-CoA hydratase/carnithine racemase